MAIIVPTFSFYKEFLFSKISVIFSQKYFYCTIGHHFCHVLDRKQTLLKGGLSSVTKIHTPGWVYIVSLSRMSVT